MMSPFCKFHQKHTFPIIAPHYTKKFRKQRDLKMTQKISKDRIRKI